MQYGENVMLEEMKKRVCEANLDLVAKGVVIYTWGNVSEIDRETGYVVIKPSGVEYDGMKPEDGVRRNEAGRYGRRGSHDRRGRRRLL